MFFAVIYRFQTGHRGQLWRVDMNDRRERDERPEPPSDHGPLGDVTPHEDDSAAPTGGSLKPAKVEDRPNVGTVKPEDYPAKDRARMTP